MELGLEHRLYRPLNMRTNTPVLGGGGCQQMCSAMPPAFGGAAWSGGQPLPGPRVGPFECQRSDT